MTHSQLDYLGLQETKRNNLATLAETGRHNQATEQETKRNNLIVSTEQVRSNKENERIGRLNVKQSRKALSETRRNNLVVSKETNRHNKATEAQAKRSTSAQIQVAQIGATSRTNAAQISAQASRDVAATNAQTTRYVAELQAAQKSLDRLTSRLNTQSQNATNKQIAEIKREGDLAVKKLDNLQKDKGLTNEQKLQAKRLKQEYDLALKKMQNDKDLTAIKMFSGNLDAFVKASTAKKGK